MRALLVSTEFPPGPGGIGTHAFELARGLVRLGWQVRVNTPQDYASDDEIAAFARELQRERLPVDRVRRRGLGRVRAVAAPGRVLSVLGSLKRLQPDVVLASGRAAVWLCASTSALRVRRRGHGPRVPWVAIGHGTEFGNRRGLSDRLTRWALMQADSVICVSEFTRRRMHTCGIVPRAETVIPNGADPDAFPVWPPQRIAAWRAGHGLVGKRLLLTVGHVSERKGQDLVVRALPRIRERVPDVRYVAVGLPSRAGHLMALARELGVGEQVRFPGRVSAEERLAWLQAADVFVLTSRMTAGGDCEGYGIAAVEAAFCGVPAVVAGGSGLAEAVAHGRTGLVVPPENPAAIAEAVTTLCTDESLRQRFGQAARERALAEQTWAHRLQAYDAWLRGRIEIARRTMKSPTAPASASAPSVPAAAHEARPVADVARMGGDGSPARP